jgi:hypothetical protein
MQAIGSPFPLFAPVQTPQGKRQWTAALHDAVATFLCPYSSARFQDHDWCLANRCRALACASMPAAIMLRMKTIFFILS